MVALRGAAVVPSGNPTTSFTVVIPSQVLTNDVLFLLVTSRDSTGAGTLSCTDDDSGGNTWTKIGNSTDHKITLWYKRATSATASKTITIANAVGSSAGVLKCFSGALSSATPYANIVIESNASADESHAGFTPSQANSMICAGVCNTGNDNAVTSLSFATAGATTMTEKTSMGGSDCAAAFGHVVQSGGPTGTGTLTWSQTNGTTYSITWEILIQKYELDCAPGSYSFSGAAAGLGKAYTMDAQPGSYSITGVAASLLKAKAINAETGSYAITGVAAQLARNRFMDAAPGSYAISGLNATLAKGYNINAESGSYALNGVAASFLRALVINAEPGAYSLSGIAASLLQHYVLNAESGAYVWTGASAQLAALRAIAAMAGSYAWDGAALSALAHRILNAAPGSYLLNGTPANLLALRALRAEPGAYTLNGVDALLEFIPGGGGQVFELNCEPGSYSVTGANASLLANRSITLEPGTYLVVGADARLNAHRVIQALAGAYNLTGEQAQLAANRVMNLEPGTYVVNGVPVTFDWSGLVEVIGPLGFTAEDLRAAIGLSSEALRAGEVAPGTLHGGLSFDDEGMG